MCRRDRQEKLRAQYSFSCQCTSCCDESLERTTGCRVVGLKCPSAGCRGAVQAASEAGVNVFAVLPQPPGSGRCCACGHVMDSKEAVAALRAALTAAVKVEEADSLLQACESADDHQLQAALVGAKDKYTQALTLRREVLHNSNQLVGAVHQSLARVECLLGDLDTAAGHCSEALKVIVSNYPPRSTAEGFQRAALADLHAAAAVGEEDLPAVAHQAEAAASILELHFGSASARAVEMRHLLATLSSSNTSWPRQAIEEAAARACAWAAGQ
mmetsp:Transcript_9025/g.25933  ORF Transcript_9025/g.25933 Transcript_9025/m.25933 type:complete len:271 (-) Transcript_9025:148-960(-)